MLECNRRILSLSQRHDGNFFAASSPTRGYYAGAVLNAWSLLPKCVWIYFPLHYGIAPPPPSAEIKENIHENNKRIEGLGVGWPQAHEGRRPSAQQKHVHDIGGKNKCLRFNGHTSNAPGSQPRPITKIRNTPRLVKSCYCLSCSLTLFVSPTQPQPHKYGRTPAPVGVSKTSIGCPTNMEKIHGNVEVAALVPKE